MRMRMKITEILITKLKKQQMKMTSGLPLPDQLIRRLRLPSLKKTVQKLKATKEKAGRKKLYHLPIKCLCDYGSER